jgi:branched-chain amino acid transport system substrate-binding protein
VRSPQVNAISSDAKRAGGTDPAKLREALLATRNLQGTCNFDANGDELRIYNIVRNQAGRITFVRIIAFKE